MRVLALLLALVAPAAASNHTILMNSSWGDPAERGVMAIISVDDDQSGITIRGLVWDNTGVASVTIETVDPAGKIVVLARCPGDICNYHLEKTAMVAGANDVYYILTNTRGQHFAATTKITRPP